MKTAIATGWFFVSTIALSACGGTNDAAVNPSQTGNQSGNVQTGNTQTEKKNEMGFFVTSVGLWSGANLGGLAGADKHCQDLAEKVGAGSRTWHAYLSTQGAWAVNARDRIGTGPWFNANGMIIANSVNELHASNFITKRTALTEKREIVNGRGDTPNTHDMLTGSQPDGRAFPSGEDRTCGNWTKSGTGSAMLGHSDRMGTDDSAATKSWNSAHLSRGPGGGCGQDDLKSTGGAGLYYCFAVDAK